MSITLLSATDVKQCVTMGDAIESIENAFLQLANSTEPPIHFENIKKDAHINTIGSHSRTMHFSHI